MVLLALTEFGAVLLALCAGVCIDLVVYALWPLGWHPKSKTEVRRLAWVLLAPLEFSALWLWLNAAIGILLWLLVFGDNLNEFRMNVYVRMPAALIAIVTSAAVALRLARGAATRRFAHVHLWATVLLLVVYGGMRAYDYVSRIEGITAQRAAENYMARNPARLLDGARLVERNCNTGPKGDASRHKCYWIMVANQPKARFTLYKMGWFAWTVGSSRGVEPSRPQLDRAKQAIRERDPDLAEFILKEVIEDYPGTADGAEARELLRSLNPTTKPAAL